MAPIRIVALEGDETGQELLEQSLRPLEPGVLGLELEVVRYDPTAIYSAVDGAIADGVRTSDLGGHAGTVEFTDAVISRIR